MNEKARSATRRAASIVGASLLATAAALSSSRYQPLVGAAAAAGTGTKTLIASQFANSNGMNTEFAYHDRPEAYARAAIIADLSFLHVGGLRDTPSRPGGREAPFTTFCAAGGSSSYASPQTSWGFKAFRSGYPAGTYTYTGNADSAGAATLGVASTLLSAAAVSTAAHQLVNGDSVVIDPYGTHPETRVIGNVAGNELTFAQPLAFAHTAGQFVSLDDATQPVLLTPATIADTFREIRAAQGCFPYFIEPGNEEDNHARDIPAFNLPDPQDTVGHAPMWATLYVRTLATMRAAKASSGDFGRINIYGPGLDHISNYGPGGSILSGWPELSLAQHDFYVLGLASSPFFPVDVAVQHNGLTDGGDTAAPDGAAADITKQANAIYVDTNPDANGRRWPAGYATPNPSTGMPPVPQVWDEFGEAYTNNYFFSSEAIPEEVADHYVPRYMLALFAAGVARRNYWDFMTDHPVEYGHKDFQSNGIADEYGNIEPHGYAMANLLAILGNGNIANALTASRVVPLDYGIVVPGTAGRPANVASYTFENDDGSYWIVINSNAEEATIVGNHPNGARPNLAGFSSAVITGLPASIKAAAVYQNDEYCDATHWQPATPYGTPFFTYPRGANTDCEQWWPAGSLQHAIQQSYPPVSNGTIGGLRYNGMPLLIHVGGGRLPVEATQTPLPFATPGATPTPKAAVAPVAPTISPTPNPAFGPPHGSVPVPPPV